MLGGMENQWKIKVRRSSKEDQSRAKGESASVAVHSLVWSSRCLKRKHSWWRPTATRVDGDHGLRHSGTTNSIHERFCPHNMRLCTDPRKLWCQFFVTRVNPWSPHVTLLLGIRQGDLSAAGSGRSGSPSGRSQNEGKRTIHTRSRNRPVRMDEV